MRVGFPRSTFCPVLATLLACGGGTLDPKVEELPLASPAEAASARATTSSAYDAVVGVDPSVSAGDPSPTSPVAIPAPSAAPAADDPFNAPNQMPTKDMAKTMRGVAGKVNACFKGTPKPGPDAEEVKIRVVVTSLGFVRAWRDEGSQVSDGGIVKCVGGVVERLKFPKQRMQGDAWATYSVKYPM